MPGTITVEIPYTIDSGEKLVNETFGPNNIRRSRTGSDDRKPMSIQNGRLFGDRLSLDEQGFVFVTHDGEQLKSVYYPEVEQLIRRESGAARVVIFDHTLRSGDETERETKLIREPVLSAHNDYTEWSGPNRVREIFPDDADELLKRRFAIIQVWRAINQPIRANPLALADAKSVAMDDLLVAERRYPHRVGQTYRDEALVFKVYDSDTGGRARFTPHTSFADPASPPNAPPRQSIEVRALAFFAS